MLELLAKHELPASCLNINCSVTLSYVVYSRVWNRRSHLNKHSPPPKTLTSEGPDHLGPGLGNLGRFLDSTWDRELWLSEFACFGISWNLSKFDIVYTNFIFIISKGRTLRKNSKTPKICQNCPKLGPRWSGSFNSFLH